MSPQTHETFDVGVCRMFALRGGGKTREPRKAARDDTRGSDSLRLSAIANLKIGGSPSLSESDYRRANSHVKTLV